MTGIRDSVAKNKQHIACRRRLLLGEGLLVAASEAGATGASTTSTGLVAARLHSPAPPTPRVASGNCTRDRPQGTQPLQIQSDPALRDPNGSMHKTRCTAGMLTSTATWQRPQRNPGGTSAPATPTRPQRTRPRGHHAITFTIRAPCQASGPLLSCAPNQNNCSCNTYARLRRTGQRPRAARVGPI